MTLPAIATAGGLSPTAAAALKVIWEPQSGPQTALIECPVFEIFFGGARGGGKTESSIGDWLQHSSTYGEGAIGIFVRRKLTQLSEVIARTKQIFPKLGAKYNEQQKTWTMPGGGRLKFVYLERDSDAEEYQGHNYTRVYVEEVTNFPSPAPIDKLRATLRSATGVPVGMRLTGNPGGPGHNWVKARYIDPNPRGYQVIPESTTFKINGVDTTVTLHRVFIPSKLGDNQLLLINDPTYVLRLRQSGSEALVRAWLEGDWSIIDGAYFSEFDPAQHILQTEYWLNRIPRTATKFRAMDWGSAKPFSVGWYALSDGKWGLPEGALLKFAEWYGSAKPNVGLKMTDVAVAEGILNREREMQVRCDYGVADPAIFIQNGGPSIAEKMNIAGVSWRPADNKRIPGWNRMREMLAWNEKDDKGQIVRTFEPKLYFLDCCYDSIRTIPVLQHDETNSEDIDTDGEDHAGDETRYACMSRPWQKIASGSGAAALPKLPSQTTINELIERLRQRRLARENQD